MTCFEILQTSEVQQRFRNLCWKIFQRSRNCDLLTGNESHSRTKYVVVLSPLTKIFSCITATREKISSAACPTPGCKGIGHVKGAKYSTHHSTFGCPYSLQNLNKDSCLVDRLSNNSMTEESDWSYASKQKLAVVKAIKGKELCENALVHSI